MCKIGRMGGGEELVDGRVSLMVRRVGLKMCWFLFGWVGSGAWRVGAVVCFDDG
jgi:hypothetical protein